MTGTDMERRDAHAGELYRQDCDSYLVRLTTEVTRLFGDELPVLADEPEALAQGIARLDVLTRNLARLRSEAERLLLDAMGDARSIDVPHVGRVERHVPKDRPRWDSEALLGALIRQALDPDGTGELPASPLDAVAAVLEVLVECAPFTPSLGWRKTPLKARGLLAGGKPDDLDEVDDDGRARLADRAGYLTYVAGTPKVRLPSLEGTVW